MIGTGVNLAEDAGDTYRAYPPFHQYFGWGALMGISPQYYYVLLDKADKH